MMAEVAVSRWMRRRGGRRRRPAAAALYDDVTVGATGEEFELQVAMFEEVLCVAVLFTDVDPIIRSLFRRFTRPSSLLGSSKLHCLSINTWWTGLGSKCPGRFFVPVQPWYHSTSMCTLEKTAPAQVSIKNAFQAFHRLQIWTVPTAVPLYHSSLHTVHISSLLYFLFPPVCSSTHAYTYIEHKAIYTFSSSYQNNRADWLSCRLSVMGATY
ncbi:uncharacterized protein LOC125878876 isoform X1 [Epinephelus fuscoguttatus]|uniref:uncharacterized protein LOC125878876 isoform X1 n=1 Tax=Epinephelus fuscoguttatus TaxID=293821 RepID=UPI0020D16C74|nr:uncharacterized protein LOC125878876 isoform X1 [Epinephelus fuscoguttatus]